MKNKWNVILSISFIALFSIGLFFLVINTSDEPKESAKSNDEKKISESTLTESTTTEPEADVLLLEKQPNSKFSILSGTVQSIMLHDEATREIIISNEQGKETFKVDSYTNVLNHEGKTVELTLGMSVTVYVKNYHIEQHKEGEPYPAHFILGNTEDQNMTVQIDTFDENWTNEDKTITLAVDDTVAIQNLSGSTLSAEDAKNKEVAFFYDSNNQDEKTNIKPHKITVLSHDVEIEPQFTPIELPQAPQSNSSNQ